MASNTNPSLTVEYLLPTNPDATPYSITIARALDGANFATSSYTESWAFTDALGRTITTLSQANPSDGDDGDWIVAGSVEYNTKGEVIRAHDPWFHTGAAETFNLGQAPPSGATCAPRGPLYQEYDPFGRVVTKVGRDGLIDAVFVHHALSQDVYDAADLGMGPAMGTYATLVSDGHGRAVQRTEHFHEGVTLVQRHVLNDYLPTGEVRRIIQRKSGSTDVVRWLRYDSLGRMVLNAEPNTSPNFNADPDTLPSNIKAWRYAYNDAGDLVGTSDARGCGANYHYAAGRLIAEDRSPCLSSHAAYTTPNLVSGDGTEAFYLYDAADPDSGSITDKNGQAFTVNASYLAGRLASVSGLGSKTVFQYDPLGRVTGTAVRVVKPGAPASSLTTRYAPAWYTKTQTLDVLDRPLTATSGLPGKVTEPEPPGPWEPLLGTGNTSQAAFGYAKTGRVKTIGGSYGTLFAGSTHLADGRPVTLTLGDTAQTERAYCYDVNQRVATVETVRAAPSLWTSPPGGYAPPAPGDFTDPLTLEHYAFTYDAVDNITDIDDFRVPAEWPTSAKPVHREFEYDDLYRLTRATYEIAGGGTDAWISPYAAENSDPTRRPKPSPHVSFTNRVQQQNFAYDWLGNPAQTTDDQQAFWDRSLGDTTRGTALSGPNRITAASNRTLAPSSPRKGDLSSAYDAAGNLTDLISRRDGPCLPAGATCWQRFLYEWNELGELTRARRWDLTTTEQAGSENNIASPPPSRAADADLTYTYGPGGDRVLKTSVDSSGTRHTVYIFGSLELRSTTWDSGAAPPDYVFNASVIQLRLRTPQKLIRDSD